MTDIYDKLTNLIKLDIDAVQAYEQAIEKIDDPMIADQLLIFKQDHQMHIDDLSSYLIDNGQEAPKQSPDLKAT